MQFQIWLFCLGFSLTQPIGKAVVGEKMAVEISFTNPLPQVLKAVTFNMEGLGLLTARKIKYGWGGKINFMLCSVSLYYLLYASLLWLLLSFPVLPSEILAVVHLCLSPSTSPPPCLDRGNYWLRWTASSSLRFTVWSTSLWRKKATRLHRDLKTEELWQWMSFPSYRHWYIFSFCM